VSVTAGSLALGSSTDGIPIEAGGAGATEGSGDTGGTDAIPGVSFVAADASVGVASAGTTGIAGSTAEELA